MKYMPLLLSLFIVGLAFAFVIPGDLFVNRIPTIRTFWKKHEQWSRLVLERKSLSDGTTFCPCGFANIARLMEQLSGGLSNQVATPLAVLDEIGDKRLGVVATVVFYKKRQLRALARELRVTSGVFLVILGGATLYNQDGVPLDQITLDAILSHHAAPFVELVMLMWLLVRLFVEVQSIKLLLEPEGI